MKTKLCMFMLLLLCLMSCNNEDELITFSSSDINVEAKANHFYGVKRATGGQTKGIAQLTNLWYNGTTIKVKFLNGIESDKEIVKKYAAEWEKYANIKFNFVEDSKADVRIGFDWNEDRYITWSYIGTDCKIERNQDEATMSFAYWDMASERDKQGDVLRAFGQVLGLELEHRHLNFEAGWSSRISQYWEGEINDIPWEDLKEFVFDPLEASNVVQTKEYDENSIMIWPFSVRYATNTARGFNFELSAMDIEFIKQLYPKLEPVVTLSWDHATVISNVTYQFVLNEDVVVDWGDGVIDTLVSNGNDLVYTNHFYYGSDTGSAFKIYGSEDAVVKIYFDMMSFPVHGTLDVSRSRALESLDQSYFLCIKNLDVSKNTKLKHLGCRTSDMAMLDLSKNRELEFVELESVDLKSVDLSKNALLTSLKLKCKVMEDVSLSNNLLLEKFTAEDSALKKLDFSNNSKLNFVELAYIPLSQDRAAMIDMANSLPVKDQQAQIHVAEQGAASWIKDICTAKNWYVY